MKENEKKPASTGGGTTNNIAKLENLFHHAGKVINHHYHRPTIINITLNVTGAVSKEELAKTVSAVVTQVKKDCGNPSEAIVAVESQVITSGILLAGPPLMLLKALYELAKVVGKEMIAVKPAAAEPAAKSFLLNPFSQPSPAMVAATFARLLLVMAI